MIVLVLGQGSTHADEFQEPDMSLLKRLLWWKRRAPVRRVRICVECGMPVGEHRDWCSIYRTLREKPELAGLSR